MPDLTWVEDNASRSATIYRLGRRATSSYKKSWKIFGASDDLTVHDDVNQRLWNLYQFWQYPNQPLNQLQVESYTLEYLGDEAWQLTATYVSRGADDDTRQIPVRRSRSFDTSGGSTHITTQPRFTDAVATEASSVWDNEVPTYGDPKSYSATAEAPPDTKGAIGVDGERVAGVDIVIPALQWTENYDVPASYISTAYVKRMSAMTGSVNNGPFRGFLAGEVLFMGGTGSQEWDDDKGDGPWSLSYKFVASPNADGSTLPKLRIGDIEDIEKKGHEYLWTIYRDAVDELTLLKRPQFVFVNQVYPEANFGLLGIGVD